ncbi:MULTISPECIES: RNA polymerase sigma factor [unclassified Novosphingobium]|uniref:RNA polymerase sigma factor n=1 Tax=unclassified Novosphingobium TaxID=2644732 RepID=UPI001F466497|nr:MULTISPECIES: RNA polymerase sigma factor [unclassified Novosphingobium]
MAHHHDSLRAYVRSLVDSPPLAADIVQETWVRAIPSLREEKVGNVRAFLYRIARNLVIDGARERGKWSPWVLHEDLGGLIADDAPSPERAVLARDRLRLLLELVESLPPRCREVFALRKIEGLHQAEIAERLGITRGAVEKHLRHALLVLAMRLGEIDGAA